MGKYKYIILVIVLLISTFVLGFILGKNSNKVEIEDKEEVREEIKQEYEIILDLNYSYYEIKVGYKNIEVTKYNIVECIQAPCDPMKEDNYTVKNSNKYIKMFNRIYKEYGKDKITINYSELEEEDKKLFSKIIKVEYKEQNNYKVIKMDDYNSEYEKKGYYIEKENGKFNIVVSAGMKPTGGYSIDVVKVVVLDDSVQIYIEENTPPAKSVVTDALTYPCIKVSLDKEVKDILVQNLDTYENYKLVK